MSEHDRNSQIAVLEAMTSVFVPPPEYNEAMAAVTEVVTNVAVRKDADAPWGEGNRAKCRAVLIGGLSRTGKSELAEQIANALPDLVSVDGQPVAHRPLFVECPSSFQMSLLFNLIVHDFTKGQMKRELSHNAAYMRIETQLPVHRPTLLVLDEFQYAANPRGVREATREGIIKKLFGFIRHLLDHAAWPVPVLLIGLPEVEAILDRPGETFLHEKTDRIRIAPMIQGSAEEMERLRSALQGYCEAAGIDNAIADADFFKRLIHATDHARGLALELCQTSVMRAWLDGRRPLQIADFAERYRISTRSPADENPFIVSGWHSTNRNRLAKDSQATDAAKSRKRSS